MSLCIIFFKFPITIKPKLVVLLSSILPIITTKA